MITTKWIPLGNVSVNPGGGIPYALATFTDSTIITSSRASITPLGDLTGVTSAVIGDIDIINNVISTDISSADPNLYLSPQSGGMLVASQPILADKSIILKDPAGSNTITLQASTLSGDYTLTFPTTAGGTAQMLLSTAGVLSWGDPITSGGSSTDTAIVRWNGTSGLILENSGVLIDASNNVTGILALTASGYIESKTSIILEDPGAGTNKWTIQSPTLVSDYVLTLPVDDGTIGQVLTTDGSGVTSWTSGATGTLTGPIFSSNTAIALWNGTSALILENSGVFIDSFNNITGVKTLASSGALQSKTSLVLVDPGVSSNHWTIQSPTLASNYTLTLPVDDGTPGQILSTDGSGITSWIAPAAGTITGPGSSSDTAVVRWNGTTGLVIENSGVLIDGSNNITGVATLTATGAIRSNTSILLEDPGAGTNKWTIQSPTLASDYTLTLPTTAGTSGQALITDGSGTTSWTTLATGTVTGPGSSTNTAIARWSGSGGTALLNTGVTIDGSDNIATTGNFVATGAIKTRTSLILKDPGVSSNTWTIQSPTLSSNYIMTFPVDDGTAGQVFTTDGSGVMSWTTPVTGTVSGPGTSTNTAIPRWNGTTGLVLEDSSVLIDGSNNITGIAALTATGAIKSKTSFVYEDPGAGTHTVTVQAPTLGSNWTFTLPTGTGTSDQVLATDGSGNASWITPISAFGSTTNTAIATWNGTLGTVLNNTGVLIDGSNNITGVAALTATGTLRSNTSLKLEDPGAGTHVITIQAPTLALNNTITLPVADGASGQVITTDGSSNWSWVNRVVGPGSSTSGAIATYADTTGNVIQDNSITISGTTIAGITEMGVGGTPDASAAIDLTSTTQGIGLPVMTTTQKNAISTPKKGLMVFDKTAGHGYLYNGTSWVSFG